MSWQKEVLLAHCAKARPSPGGCGWCGAPLPPRSRRWCSPKCGDDFWRNHWWPMARRAAKRRDRRRCVRCGVKPERVEVNHRQPCLGRHGSLSCSHHLDNLETLCVTCHAEHTRALVFERQSPAE